MPSPTPNVCMMTAPQRAAIDTNVLVALVDSRDHWHPNAQALREALQGSAADLVYLDPVLKKQGLWLDLKLLVLSFWMTLRGKWEYRGRKF